MSQGGTGQYGKVIHADLRSETADIKSIGQRDVRHWLSGRAMNVALIYQYLRGYKIDPFSQDNPLIFSAGLLVGSSAPSSSRLHINAISPLTGLLGSSNIGGNFAARLKRCGFDAILVKGRANGLVYIEIDETGAVIKNAAGLKGLDTHDTHRRLCEMSGVDSIESLVIGPAGENLSRYACIVTGQDHAAGRTGLGAVMGNKGLKAIVVKKPARKSPGRFLKTGRDTAKAYFQQILMSPDFEVFSKLGGAGYVTWANDQGVMSTRNYQETYFDNSGQLDGQQLKAAISGSRGCTNCPIRCKAVLEFSQGRMKGRKAYRPEFEPILNLGAKCGLDNAQDVVYLDNLCTRLGLDSTSASTAIAFAMDLFERGLLPDRWSTGLDLTWGNSETMEKLIIQMAENEGLGGLLGRGTRYAAEIFGSKTLPFAAQVKGLELSAYHPATLLGSALGYAVSSRGGDYNNVYASLEHRWTPARAKESFGTEKALDPASYEGKGRLVHRAVMVNIIVDSLGICKVPALSMIGTFDLEPEAKLVSALTVWKLSAGDLFDIGEQVAHLERMININQGMIPEDDTLPDMFFDEGQYHLEQKKFQRMVQDFYAAMKWDRNGRPTTEQVKEANDRLPSP
jgi:aldehyde:ferredoxin oxidoreductase